MTTRIEASIGRVYGNKHLPISDALEHFAGHPISEEQLQGWAGPNDFLQIIMDWASWQNLAMLGASTVATASATKLSQLMIEDGYQALKRILSKSKPSEAENSESEKFLQLSRAIDSVIADGWIVTLGLRTAGEFRNNMGIELRSGDLAQLLDNAAVLGEIGKDLTQMIEAENLSGKKVYGATNQDNRDGGPKIQRLQDGSIAVPLQIVNNDGKATPITIRFDAEGKRVE